MILLNLYFVASQLQSCPAMLLRIASSKFKIIHFQTQSGYLEIALIRNQLIEHIKVNAKDKNIWLDSIGGHSEHLHCLISLNREISIKDTMQLIKGESSHWLNKSKLLKEKFNWQDDYWMVGVSESHLNQVRSYIENQDIHYAKKKFNQEINEFMKKHGWELINE